MSTRVQKHGAANLVNIDQLVICRFCYSLHAEWSTTDSLVPFKDCGSSARAPHNQPKRIEMKRTILAVLSVATTFAVTSPAFADEALAKAKNCMACHAVDKKVVGPAYKDVAKKYAGDAKAAAMLTTKVIKGGAGVWGPVPMPANAQVNEAESKKLVAWILAMK
jgi:cytochrome c